MTWLGVLFSLVAAAGATKGTSVGAGARVQVWLLPGAVVGALTGARVGTGAMATAKAWDAVTGAWLGAGARASVVNLEELSTISHSLIFP